MVPLGPVVCFLGGVWDPALNTTHTNAASGGTTTLARPVLAISLKMVDLGAEFKFHWRNTTMCRVDKVALRTLSTAA